MDSDVSVKEVMEMAADDIVAAGTKDTTTFDAIVKDAKSFLSEAVDVGHDVIDGSLAKMAKDAKKQQGIVIAGKALVQSLAREVETLAEAISAGKATDADMLRFTQMESRLVEVSANLKSVITGSAQTTAAGRIRTADWVTGKELTTSRAVEDALASGDTLEAIRLRAAAIKANKDAGGAEQGLLRIVDRPTNTPIRIATEFYINSILSGVKTQMVNLMSNSLNTLLLPSEKLVGGLMGGDTAMMREGFKQFQGIYLSLKDSMKMAGTAWKNGRNILDPEAAILEANGVDYHAIKYTGENQTAATLVNGKFGVGNIVRLPSRALQTGDELFKQINYRASLYARLSTEAADLVKAGKLTQQEAAKFVSDRMVAGIDRNGAAVSQVDLDFAREATYTQELRKGSASKRVQDFTNHHPWSKLIVPFVRTPINILRATGQRTPIVSRLSKTLMEDLKSGDPRRVASARGKVMTGRLVWGSAALAAMEGKLTGSGPKDSVLRARLYETGWKPYSFVVTDSNGGKRYVPYNRLEPFGTIFGIAADMAEIGGQVGDTEYEELASAAIVALTNNVTSKSYLQGLADHFDALSDPDRYLDKIMQKYAASAVPFSSAMRDVRKVQDPHMREVRSMLDAIRNTIPGLSDDLPARRSWVTGEPILYPKGWGPDNTTALGEAVAAANPLVVSEWKQDPVLDELANLNFAFSPPARTRDGVELNSEQYSRLLELHGTIRNGRLNMYQALERVMQNKKYDINRERFQDDVDPSLNPRVQAIQRVITMYRRAAWQKLVEEDPELKSTIAARRQEAATAARSAYSGIADLAQ
jgi:hypothetical protein